MKSFICIFIGMFSVLAFAQEKEEDSLNASPFGTQNLDRVVLTGQYERQSVDKSVFEVNVISQKDMKMLAANDLSDVLNQTLNMNIVPQAGEGRAGIQQFGFNSEYVKILVDNVPVVGDEGFGNAIDITQINLDDIKQIEIVEGSMGVEYGANAVTGVVNIITKKNSDHSWQITPYLQEETAGDEYGLFDRGRHIQSIKVGHNFSDKLFARVSYLRNDFRGFKAQKQGKNYFNRDNPNDGLRGFQWLPKEQNTAKALLRYTDGDFKMFYKFEYFHEETNRFNEDVILNENPATSTVDPTAQDKTFRSKRFYHHLNASGLLGKYTHFNISASFQKQTRNLEEYIYELKTGRQSDTDRYDYNTREGFFSRGNFNNFFDLSDLTTKLGYSVTLDKGSASGLSAQNISENTQENTVNSYAGFASAEWQATDRLSFRPGVRVTASSEFSSQTALSFSSRYRFENGYQLRLIAGTAPKLPNFEQLYFYMVDSNHNVQGNENLNPEKGKSVFVHFKKTFFSDNYDLKWTPKLSGWYLDVKDKIDLIITKTSPLTYQYNNIDLYKTWGLAFRNKLNYNQFSGQLGVAFSGESKVLNNLDNNNEDFLYAFQINSNISYQFENSPTSLSAYFKFNGPQYQFINYIDDDGNNAVRRGKLDSYGWLNLSARHSFFDKKLTVTAGSRNVLDVKRINTTATAGSSHDSSGNSRLLGYGRSYFVKLLYNLNF